MKFILKQSKERVAKALFKNYQDRSTMYVEWNNLRTELQIYYKDCAEAAITAYKTVIFEDSEKKKLSAIASWFRRSNGIEFHFADGAEHVIHKMNNAVRHKIAKLIQDCANG